MEGIKVLLLVLCSLPSLLAQCCQKKTVSGTVASDKGLNGVYTLVKDVADAKDSNCADGCIYNKDGNKADEYCFQAVPDGATIMDECSATTGGPSGPQTTLSSDQLRDEAKAAAARVEENQKIVEEESNKMESANDATNAISEIQSKLTGSSSTASGRLQQREKRQAETTVAPVDAPKNCTEFDTLYINLLSMAAAVTDSNIFQIKAIVIVLRPIEPDTLCSSAEKSALATKAQADVDKAVAKTKEYAGQKKDIVEQKKVEINKDLAIQQNANQQLEEREEPTVPTKQSTYKVEATQPIGGGNNEATTQPAGGDGGSNEATTKPAGGNNEPTTKPAGGNMEATTKPAGGNMESTPGAAGGNMESTTKPAGSNIEATSQPAGQTQAMSTVKPGRRIFDSVNKRSRGSIKRS